jgi:hypothetical protein
LTPAALARRLAPALVVAAGLALALVRHADELARYDRYTQPGFDARVYVAMGDDPAFFTLAPWGYRLLLPWLAHALSREPGLPHFLGLALGALFVSGLLLDAWLRRLGHGPPARLLALALFAFSPPVAQAVGVPFLAEPLIFLLLTALLLALEARAPLAVLALLAALGALGKDIFLYFLPLVFFHRRPDAGTARALRDCALVALPAIAVTWTLRAWWTPGLAEESGAGPTGQVFWLALWRILAGAPRWIVPALLLGAAPLALAGALRREARPFLARHLWLLAMAWALPFAASVYTDDLVQVPFFADDIPRLLLYGLPPTLHLALLALGRWLPPGGPDGVAAWPRWPGPIALAATLAVLAFPFLALDRYRRLDLRGPRDGPLLLATCRQSLAFARRLEAGRTLAYEVETRRFRPGRDEPRYLERQRWFLREGWGAGAHHGVGPALLRGRRGTLLLPCLRPADLTLTFAFAAPSPAALAVAVNGRELARAAFEGDLRLKVHVPGDLLFRGDNLVALEPAEGGPAIELRDLRVQPER